MKIHRIPKLRSRLSARWRTSLRYVEGQDWELMNADPARVAEFIDSHAEAGRDDFERSKVISGSSCDVGYRSKA